MLVFDCIVVGGRRCGFAFCCLHDYCVRSVSFLGICLFWLVIECVFCYGVVVLSLFVRSVFHC